MIGAELVDTDSDGEGELVGVADAASVGEADGVGVGVGVGDTLLLKSTATSGVQFSPAAMSTWPSPLKSPHVVLEF